MTCIIDLDAYMLHMGHENSSTTLLMNDRVLHYTYVRGSLLFKTILYIYLNDYVSMRSYMCEQYKLRV